MDQGGFTKLFIVLPKYLSAFNYKGLNPNETKKEFEQFTLDLQTFWDKKYRKMQLIKIV